MKQSVATTVPVSISFRSRWSGTPRRGSGQGWFWAKSLLAAVLLMAALSGGNLAHGQSGITYPLPQSPAQNTAQNPGRPQLGQEQDTTQDAMVHRALEEAAKKRNAYRQNKLVANSDRIVQLAQELGVAAQPEGQAATSPVMVKKADEIEKLARSVKDLMKSE